MAIIDAIAKIVTKEKVKAPEDFEATRTFDYSTRENRINTVNWLFDQAKIERSVHEAEWERLNDYYNFNHDVSKEMREALNDMSIPFVPASVPDPWIMVESQINPDVPQPEFHGRDDDKDGEKAEERRKAVKFVTDNNRINDMNTANERRLRKYGDAFWKVYWDASMPCGNDYGDIRIKDIPIEDIYVDPTANRIEDAEYIDYVYTLHKFKFWRLYHKEVEEQGYSLDDVSARQYRKDTDFLQNYTRGTRCKDDLVQIIEHWFRQPFDGDGFQSGDIACTIQAGNIELKYIPKYWETTGRQNKLFPFVHYWCIHDETGFYNKSEIEPIIEMVDSADRELAIGMLNDAMTSNDIILAEEGALAAGEEITNLPGSIIKVRQGKMNSVARLGGLHDGIRSADMISFLQNQMQRTNRNYDTNNGQESSKVTTASGLLQLRSDAAAQGELKKADRNKGFCRLYELIDWTCLEFYTDDRFLFLGIDEQTKEPQGIRYNSARYAESDQPFAIDEITLKVMIPEDAYWPRVDVTVTCGDGIGKNPASTVQVLDRLAAVQVTADNWELLAAELEYLDIPQKQSIVDTWRKKYGSEVPEEVIQALQSNQQMLQAVEQMVQQVGTGQQPAGQQAQLGTAEIVDNGLDVPTY